MASSGSGAIGRIDRAHEMYRDGRYEDALSFYTDALSLARNKLQQIALHSNRAACFLKLHDFEKAAEECTSVLELDREHTGALMLRAQTLVTLKEYHSALFDVNRLIELNPSSEVYKDLEARLRTQLSLAPIPELEEEEEEEEEHGGDEFCPARYKTEPCNLAGIDTDTSSREKRSSFTLSSVSSITRRLQGQGPGGRVGATKIAPDEVSSTQSCTNEEEDTKGWQAIPKPKGHSTLDYARWDRVADSSSDDGDDDDEDNEDDSPCKYRFRVRTVGVRPVK